MGAAGAAGVAAGGEAWGSRFCAGRGGGVTVADAPVATTDADGATSGAIAVLTEG